MTKTYQALRIGAEDKSTPVAPDFYNQQYNARAMIPDHPRIFTRWINESAEVRRRTPSLRDLAYGELPGERLDFFPTALAESPLLVFIHGGWWRSLDKSDFSFIAQPYVRAGVNVALLNYTLAPDASIDEIVRQQLRALAWLYRHAEQYEFNRDKIVLAGHSTGAHLSAMMLAALWNDYADDLPADLIKAGVLISGLYDLNPIQHADFVNVDLKLTQHLIDTLSPAFMPQSHAAPFITAVGGLESSEFQRQNAIIGSAWKSNHLDNIVIQNTNHLTICDAFASPEHPLFEATLKLLNRI